MNRFLAILCLLFCFLCLCGCENNTAEEATAGDLGVTEVDAETQAEDEDSPENFPFSLEEMNQIYEEAGAVWNYFDLDPLATEDEFNDDGSQKYYTINGVDGYKKVKDDKIATMAELKAAAEKYFSDDIVNNLINEGRYVEVNGILYEVIADRGTDITAGGIIERAVSADKGGYVIYTITTEIIDPEAEIVTGNREHTFTYTKIGDRWVFTKFQAIY